MYGSLEPSKVIVINGASSSGKTTIARSLQEKAETPFLHFSFDHLRDSNVLPMKKIRAGSIDWPTIRPAVFDGFHHCLPALAGAGNNVIVDHIIENKDWMADLVRLLSPFDVFFVGLHCSLDELERRERARGDRRPGEAKTDYHAVHCFGEYDLEIDSTMPNENNVDLVLNAWRCRSRPSAFDRMASLR